jgi:hypothetical protein
LFGAGASFRLKTAIDDFKKSMLAKIKARKAVTARLRGLANRLRPAVATQKPKASASNILASP